LKPAPFDYFKPSSLEEVFGMLEEHGDNATILAGGQSLMATLNMRLAAPELLIDINGIDDLKGISVEGDRLRIGALARHQEVEQSHDVAEKTPLIAAAMPFVAHPAVRNRGTFGGSVALADPAAELPACITALRAEIEIAGGSGRRKVPAEKFYRGLYDTDLAANELVTAVEIPVIQSGYRSAFDELARRHGDYAMAGVAAQAQIDGARISDVRLVFFAVGGTPVIAESAGHMLEGQDITDATIEAAQDVLDQDLEPFDDNNCTAETKLYYAKVLAGRVLRKIAG